MRRPAGDRVRIGVVGLGYWGPNVARNVVESPRAELAWVCDVDQASLTAAANRFPGARTTRDVRELFEDPHLDAVALTTPLATHYPLATAALQAGKHVFVEKPLAGSVAEAEELLARARRDELVLLPGHTFLYSPSIVRIKQLIDAGALGDVYFISMSRVNLGLHRTDASVVWDLAPHDFSILRYWLDELPDEVSGMTRCCVLPDTPDVAFINMRFASGAIAHLELSWLAPSKLRRTAIVGSEKMIVYDDVSNEPIRIFDSGATLPDPESFGEFRLTYRTGDIISPRIDATEPMSLEIADFCAAILDGAQPRSSGEIAVDVIRAIEAVEGSLAANGAPVRVERRAPVVTQLPARTPPASSGSDGAPGVAEAS